MQKISENILLAEIPRTQRRPLAKPLSDYGDQYKDQKVAMIKAYSTGDYTMQQIADFFGVHYATVSRAINKVWIMPELLMPSLIKRHDFCKASCACLGSQ